MQQEGKEKNRLAKPKFTDLLLFESTRIYKKESNYFKVYFKL